MLVKTWMSPPGVILPAATPIDEALRFVESKRSPHAGVMEGGRLVGYATRADLYRAASGGEVAPFAPRRTLAQALRPLLYTVRPDDLIERAVEIMVLNELTVLPVLENGRLAGVLHPRDVFSAFVFLMGLPEGGARLCLKSPSGTGLLEEALKRSAGRLIRSLAIYPDPSGGCEAVLCLRGRVGAA